MSTNYLRRFFLSVLLAASAVVPVGATQAQTATSCVILTHNLRIGSTDYFSAGDVTRLQAFLNLTGYFQYAPVGIFGNLTFRAVQSFQASRGLPATGYVGPLTRGAIQQISCGGGVHPPSGGVSIQSVSPSYGTPGTQVTIYGSGFTQDNTIYFGATSVSRISSNNGTTLTFIVPTTISAGAYAVTVQNSNGTSNQGSFTLQGGSVQGQAPVISSITGPTQLAVNQVGTWSVQAASQSQYGYSSQLTYSVNWGDGTNVPVYNQSSSYYASTVSTGSFTHAYANAGTYAPVFTVTDQYGHVANASASVAVTGSSPQGQAPYILSVSPTSGAIGSTVTITGTGFDIGQTNVVMLNGNTAATLASSNGNAITFTVPSQVWVYTPPQYCYSNGVCSDSGTMTATPLTQGTYSLTVKSSNGTSNALNFTVTSNSPQTQAPYIQSLAPTSGTAGDTVTIYGSGFTASGNSVLFNGLLAENGLTSTDGHTFTFQVPSYIGQQPITPGIYNVSVTNGNGTSVSVGFTVTSGTPQTQSPVIQSISPTSGSVQTQVTVYGSGFTANNNVLFDNQEIAQTSSSNGTSFSFVVPNAYSPSCSSSACTNNMRVISEGVHYLSIANANGTSNSVQFTVTSSQQRYTQ